MIDPDEQAAALYDVLNAWGPGDDFYLALVMAAPSVLDVGCCTGPGGPGTADGCAGWTPTSRASAWRGAAPTSTGWPARQRR
jgi:hypothetical protein